VCDETRYAITLGLALGDLHLVLDDRRRSLQRVFAALGRTAARLVLPAPRLARLVATLHDGPLDLLAELT